MPKSASHDSSFKIPDVPRPGMQNGERGDFNLRALISDLIPFSGDNVADWAGELRPSMRKLRQGMDSLCKTARCGWLLNPYLILFKEYLLFYFSHLNNLKYFGQKIKTKYAD